MITLFLFFVNCHEDPKVSLINILIPNIQSLLLDLTGMWHYVVDGVAKVMYKLYSSCNIETQTSSTLLLKS